MTEMSEIPKATKMPTDCYACWMSGEDNTDGEWCYLLERNIRWYRERRSKPLDCPIQTAQKANFEQ
jgi:hypothetical protein